MLPSKIYSVFLPLLLWSINAPIGYSQFAGEDLLKNKKESLEIPFQYVNGLILIDVYYQDFVKMKFILDTGATNTVIFEKFYPDLFQTEYTDTINVYGANLTHSVVAYIARQGIFNISRKVAVVRDYVVMPDGYINLSNVIGEEVHGILGMDFFRRLTLEIDYNKKKLIVHPPNKNIQYSSATSLPMRAVGGKPYVTTTYQLDTSRYEVELLLDTGANIPLLIHHNIVRIGVPEDYVPTFLGASLSGDIIGYKGYSRGLKLEELSITHPITLFQDIDTSLVHQELVIRDGIIGGKLLERFNIILDYSKNEVHLTKNKRFNKEYKVDRSGLIVYAHGDKKKEFVVQYVIPRSPADKAGLQKNDQILKVNWLSSKYMSLQKLMKKFQKKGNKKYKIVYLRNNSKKTTYLSLEDVIKTASSIKRRHKS